ncbi:MAG: glycosyltransferase family 2 protein [Flavobacteriia bacterium]|nr:glycosyltransferase family 2 protein [Flavobacteriia bacterium]
MKLSVIIPAYNEEKTIAAILDRVREVQLKGGMEKELIIVDDHSSDGTAAFIHAYSEKHPDAGICFFRHDRNSGKGAALRTGIEHATGDFVVIQDADLEYDPNEYNLLLQPLLDGHADVVYGSRYAGGKAHRILFFWHSFGNKFLTTLSNALTNLNLSDMETCYKMFRRELIQRIQLKENRFGFEPEVTAKISRIPNVRIYEVGISYYGRTFDEGKKIGWKDGFRAIYCILKYNLFSRY